MSQPDPYEQTCAEIKQGYIVHHLWARAACESDGNTQTTQRLYLKYRCAELLERRQPHWQPGDPCRRRTSLQDDTQTGVAFNQRKLARYRTIAAQRSGARPSGKLLSVKI